MTTVNTDKDVDFIRNFLHEVDGMPYNIDYAIEALERIESRLTTRSVDVDEIKRDTIVELCKGEQMAAVLWTEKVIDHLTTNGYLSAPQPSAVIPRDVVEGLRETIKGRKYSHLDVIRGIFTDDKESYGGYKERKGYNAALDAALAQIDQILGGKDE